MSNPKRRSYTDEFKAEAVKLVTDEGYSVAGRAMPTRFWRARPKRRGLAGVALVACCLENRWLIADAAPGSQPSTSPDSGTIRARCKESIQ